MTGGLDDLDIGCAREIEAFLASKAGEYLRAYWATQWQQIIKDAEKAKGEPHWRAQQGILKGYRLGVELPDRLVARAREQIERQEQERAGQRTQEAAG